MKKLLVGMPLLLCTIILLLSAGSCEKRITGVVANSGREITSVELQELLAFDFSSEIAELESVARNESRSVAGRIGLAAADAPDIKNSEDEKILGARRSPNGDLLCAQDAMTFISRYLSKHGQLPKTGVDLFPELATQEGYLNFIDMSPETRLLQYYAGVNLYTGKFYKSFESDPALEPGGILIQPARANGELWQVNNEEPIGYVDDEGMSMKFDGFYRFTVFGHDSQTILYYTHCGYKVNCGEQSQTQ